MLRVMLCRFVALVCLTIALAGEQLPPATQPSLLQRSESKHPLQESSQSDIDSIDDESQDDNGDATEAGALQKTDWYSEEAGQSPYPPPDADPPPTAAKPPPPPVVNPLAPPKARAPPPPPPVKSEASKTKEELKEEVEKGAASAKAMQSGVDTLKADAESMGKVQQELDAENDKLTNSLNLATELARKCEADLGAKKTELAEKKQTRDAEREKNEKAQRHHDSLEDELSKVNKEIEVLTGQVSGLKNGLVSGQERYSELAKEEADLKRELDELKASSVTRLAELQAELKEATATLTEAKSEAATLQKTYDGAASQADDLKSQLKKLREHLEAARKAADTLKVYASEAAMVGGDDDVPAPPSS